ncbi:hypothetical protein ABT297_10185 [Dactylosporangium sp. NPDC000555]|uniref:hypothetical protein n=1 Tax=Dactylosporangium sp. NPDC000555 TaxID=3154260 RepID=UPI0033267DD5
MPENSSWWLLLPCGIVAIALTVAVAAVVLAMRRATRPVLRSSAGEDAPRRPVGHAGSPLDGNWTPDNSPYNAADPNAHQSGHSSHGHDHWQSHGHTIHHDSGSSSWSHSGSSGGDSGSSHHHHSG